MSSDSIRRLLNPQSVAIIGANEKPGYGGRLMRNAIARTYKGEIFPVTPSHDTVFGYKAYPSISAIGKPVDLAIVIVKAPLVVETVRDGAVRVAKARVRVDGRRVVIVSDGDAGLDLLRAACAAIWQSGTKIHALDVPASLYR